MMNGKEVEQWPICLAVRGNCYSSGYAAILSGFPALTSSSAVPQTLKVFCQNLDENHHPQEPTRILLTWIYLFRLVLPVPQTIRVLSEFSVTATYIQI